VHAWIAARRVWSADHGDALGDFVERFQLEVGTRRAHYAAQHPPGTLPDAVRGG